MRKVMTAVMTAAVLSAAGPAGEVFKAASAEQNAGAPVWIGSENPRAVPGRPTGVMGGHGRPAGFKVWLLSGDPAKGGRCAARADGTVAVYGNDLQPVEAAAAVKRGCASIQVAAKTPGRHTLYYTTQAVAGGVRYVTSAKYERAYGRHGDKVELRGTDMTRLPFEIVRLPQEDEGLFTRFYSGDTLTFRTLHEGKPLAGADVTLTTGGGWSKRLRSDANGTVTFTLIKEYFPAWSLFDNRHRDDFVVTASFTEQGVGSVGEVPYGVTRYTTTYPGAFYPEPEGYKSYAYALLFGTGALLLTWTFVYLYRRRREKPFEEVRFDEKA